MPEQNDLKMWTILILEKSIDRFNTNVNAFLIALKCTCFRNDEYTTNVHIHSQFLFLYVAFTEFYTNVYMLCIH